MRKQYTSNLINDPELTEKFTKEAVKSARYMKKKYYSLFEHMDENDIMVECWDKILRQDISYDPEKMKFSSFVNMMVNNRCIDLSRRIKKHEGQISLDEQFGNSDNDGVSMLEYISDSSWEDEMVSNEMYSIIQGICGYIPQYPVKEILHMKYNGYNNKDISDTLNLRYSDISKIVNGVHIIVNDSINGTLTLGDVLYGDESVYYENEEGLLNKLKIITDSFGNSLSVMVSMVMKGFTYKDISDNIKGNTDEISVKEFLDKCSNILVM